MNSDKIRQFITLAGQEYATAMRTGTENQRELGAQLLLSEVLEYVMKGLGVELEINGAKLKSAQDFICRATQKPDPVEMIDGLADVAYTMYWNSETFGVPLEEGFDQVCDNNLEKFVELSDWKDGEKRLDESNWHCARNVTWPPEVETVDVVKVGKKYFAVGKDKSGKVRKPSTYRSVDLSVLVPAAMHAGNGI